DFLRAQRNGIGNAKRCPCPAEKTHQSSGVDPAANSGVLVVGSLGRGRESWYSVFWSSSLDSTFLSIYCVRCPVLRATN
ncbi:hypothetical protein BDZ89DRAFT_1078107, partial [Hymenopellis radicata]